jgi:hypothetical protein
MDEMCIGGGVVADEKRSEWVLTSIDQEDWAEVLTSLIDGREAISSTSCYGCQSRQDTELLETLLEDSPAWGASLQLKKRSQSRRRWLETPDLETIHRGSADAVPGAVASHC